MGSTYPQQNEPRWLQRRRWQNLGFPAVFPAPGRIRPRSVAPATLDDVLAAEQKIDYDLLPDNYQLPYRYVGQFVAAGQTYDFAFPSWTRHWVLNNLSQASSPGGNVYYWMDQPARGARGAAAQPQNFFTLIAAQSISEESDYQWLTVQVDPTATGSFGFELRFTGRL